MRYFDAYLMLAEVRDPDRSSMPEALSGMAMRTPAPPGKPDSGIIFFGEADSRTFGRLLEALWLDRHFVREPEGQRRLFLVGDAVYLQIGATENIQQIGDSGPIKGVVEGLRDFLEDLLDDLRAGDVVSVETPLGEREARYVEVRLPDPAAPPEEP